MRLTQTTSMLYDAALAILYPQACAVCGASVERRSLGSACAVCWHKTHIFTGEEIICWKCGVQSTGTITEERRAQLRCRRCDDAPFAAARACGLYEGALRAMVLALKREPHVPSHLAGLLFDVQRRRPLDSVTRIVPVPLHTERERERGFNQAGLLGRALSRRAHLPLDEWSLVRTLHSERHRAGMDAVGRLETVENAFRVAHPRLVAGERILLVDDVFTTGATASACAAALLAAGAQDVFILTVARP